MVNMTPEMLRRMALENPDMAARLMASQGISPPESWQANEGQGMNSPEMLSRLGAALQPGNLPQARPGPGPAVAPQQQNPQPAQAAVPLPTSNQVAELALRPMARPSQPQMNEQQWAAQAAAQQATPLPTADQAAEEAPAQGGANVGAALAGVQGMMPQGQGPAPAPGITGYQGPSGGDRLLELLLLSRGQQRQQGSPSNLAAFLPGMR